MAERAVCAQGTRGVRRKYCGRIGRKPVSIYDITADENAKYRKEALDEGIRSILSIPMRFGKR